MIILFVKNLYTSFVAWLRATWPKVKEFFAGEA